VPFVPVYVIHGVDGTEEPEAKIDLGQGEVGDLEQQQLLHACCDLDLSVCLGSCGRVFRA
jgi:hypothetical protein